MIKKIKFASGFYLKLTYEMSRSRTDPILSLKVAFNTVWLRKRPSRREWTRGWHFYPYQFCGLFQLSKKFKTYRKFAKNFGMPLTKILNYFYFYYFCFILLALFLQIHVCIITLLFSLSHLRVHCLSPLNTLECISYKQRLSLVMQYSHQNQTLHWYIAII